MSDEPDGGPFPRPVWEDFATRAAVCGFVACVMWFPIGVGHVKAFDDIPGLIIWTVTGVLVALVGTLLLLLFSTRYRHLGLTVAGSSLLFSGLVIMAVSGHAWPVTFGMVECGFLLGLVAAIRPLLSLPPLQEEEPATLARSRKFQTRYTAIFHLLGLAANLPPVVLGFVRMGNGGTLPDDVPAVAFWYMLVVSAVLCVWCWLRFLRPFVELLLEPCARLLYRIKATGTKRLPAFGPCLVVANHAFWFDPCILGVILPRPITPIMTQRFFDVWFLKPLLKYVFRVIVVPEKTMKRETPELEQAVAALDRGEVVVIFPEGYLRRKEEVPLRRFGQGVWHILRARPDTPVVACWIEGGWGSKFSYKDGPPTVNKPMDFRRKIDVAVSEPQVVPAEVLAEGIGTRIHLMNRVAAMRQSLGLSPLPAFDLPTGSEQKEEPA